MLLDPRAVVPPGPPAASDGFYRALVECSGEITVALDADGRVRYASTAVERILGHRDTWQRLGDAFALVHPEDRERVLADFRAKLDDPDGGAPITFRMRHADGGWRHLEAVGANLLHDPEVGALIVNLRDVSPRVEAEEGRARHEAHYRRALDVSPEAIAIHQDGRIVYANAAAARVLGARAVDDVVGRSVFDLIPPESLEPIAARMTAVLAGQDVELVEERLCRLDGQLVDVEVAAVPTEWNGRPAGQVVARDLTERNRARHQLERQATHDALTGLPNRVLLDARLAEAEARHVATGLPYAVVFLDVDRFKVLNDGLGHAAGDDLLQQVAARLVRAARAADTVARFGGDEFVLVLEGLTGPEDLDHVLERIDAALQPTFVVGHHEVRVRASGGVVLVEEQAEGRDLLSEADAAMYLAKRRGRGRFERFGPAMREEAAHRLALEEQLHAALDRGELVPHFQVEVDLRSGRVVGAEALVRWYHPDRGLLAPDAFLDVVDDAGLASALGDVVRSQALAELARWRAAGHLLDGWVSVNVAAADLLRSGFAHRVLADLERHGLPGSALCLEITESSIITDPDAAVAVIGELRASGITFAIDDFGTGYASLGYLRQFAPEFVKIDRSFVAGMLDDDGERAIVRSAIDMAHAFGAIAVAEGVETAEQHDALRELGCDLAQGYRYSRPVPAAEVLAPAR